MSDGKHWIGTLLGLAMIPLALACQDDPAGLADGPTASGEMQIELAPQFVTVQPGETLQLVAGLRDGDGALLDGQLAGTARWSSSRPEVVAIDEAGRIQAIGIGEAVITIGWGGRTASSTVTVLPRKGISPPEEKKFR